MPDLRNFPAILRVASLKLATAATVVAMSLGNGNLLPAQQPKQTSVAVLNDGRIFQGWMTEVPGGYRIEQPDGNKVILPFDQISVTAINLVAAYEAYRDSFRTPSAESHLMLAEWCVTNGLWSQAYTEVQSALKLEPTRSEAVALLQKLDRIVQTQQPQLSAEKLQMTAIPQLASAAERGRVETGAPLKPQLDFVNQVQPLLMNACGNGNCHGQISQNQLKLTNVRLSSRNLRLASESNVRVLLEWIDYDNPKQSPLLIKPCEKTRHHQNIFAANRHAQYKLLEQWVIQMAQERPAGMTPQPAAASPIQQASHTTPAGVRSASGIQPASVQTPGIQTSGTERTASPPATLPSAPMSLIQSQNTPELQQIRKQNRKDAFDPNAFNQMMHSAPATGTP
ncbi:hypothetical protein [Planctomicrobium sp. SH527]|uniref:hypothetical protein n=1 Tax=Planctomicrobium sp. SH527 TaxID=3448123 RepID=UPI003F5B4CE5